MKPILPSVQKVPFNPFNLFIAYNKLTEVVNIL